MVVVDHVIAGAGLAGTTLAWELARRGFRVAVVDRGEVITSSRIAAGLITPITGKRLALTWRLTEILPAAVAFYRDVEVATGSSFFTRRPALRLLADERERDIFARRRDGEFRDLVREGEVNSEWFAAPFGAFEIMDAARLDVPRYLAAVRKQLEGTVPFIAGEFDPMCDIKLPPGGVQLARFGLTARTLIFCQGFAPNPWFAGVPFQAAKGEMLTVRIPNLHEQRVVHRGLWLAPLGRELFRVGSTYEWEQLDNAPTAVRRAEIESRLREFVRRPFEVVGHVAAVRPVIDAGKPVIGLHPAHRQLGFFNGLGSKGALLAPFFARQFAAALAGTGAIDPEVDVRRVAVST